MTSAMLWALLAIGQELPEAVLANQVDVARRLILAGANARAADSHGVTPLSIAALNGNAEMVKLLLDAGADAQATLLGGETVLMTAARTGSLEAVKALVEAGADVNAAEPRRGQTALLWAAVEGHADVVDYLIGRGANFKTRLGSGFTPFLLAAREGKREVLEVLLRAGVDVNEYTEIPPKSARVPGGPRPGTTALHLAVTAGHFELAAWLLDQGANPNADLNGWTALHAITGVRKPGGGDNDPAPYGSGRMTSLELVRKLKDKGADLNARMTRKINVGLTSLNTLGATPFLLAARSADFELMRELARLGADPLIPNQDGATPLIVAAGLGTRSPGEDAGTEEEVVEAIRVALELGNDIHAVDDNGETAMHGAAYKNCGAAVRFLAERGMKPSVWNQPNKAGWTPLDIAMGYRFGNFKPSPPTEAAIREIAAKVGVVPLQSSSKNKSSY
jgi:ankyrin repeat protein